MSTAPVKRGRREVSADTAKRVYALYLELAEQAPPEDSHRDKIAASRARRFARENGWAPPLKINGKLFTGPALPDPRERLAAAEGLADVTELEPIAYDEAVVLRLLDSDRFVEHTVAERREAVRRLHARGLHSRAIADALDMTVHRVGDDLRHLGLVAHADPSRTGLSEQFTSRGRKQRAEQRGAA